MVFVTYVYGAELKRNLEEFNRNLEIVICSSDWWILIFSFLGGYVTGYAVWIINPCIFLGFYYFARLGLVLRCKTATMTKGKMNTEK
ncbi:hypothetical protein CW304_01920 [Bacillus sp. UFRGS-B20]|nr:hypothetical protein CW304_01920 [Bacillus sp. UFRGS-B20]